MVMRNLKKNFPLFRPVICSLASNDKELRWFIICLLFSQSALFNFHSFLTVVLLLICTCTFLKMQFPTFLEQKTGLFPLFSAYLIEKFISSFYDYCYIQKNFSISMLLTHLVQNVENMCWLLCISMCYRHWQIWQKPRPLIIYVCVSR